MAASYPTGFDSMSDPAANLSGPPTHSSMHNQVNDVIEAIEAELGLSPSGAQSTVAARFTAIAHDIQIFTTGTGTWTKPSGAVAVFGVAVGPGGGGGSGRRGAAASERQGGAGGGGGEIVRFSMPASALGATETYTVGAVGTGGAAIGADNTNGNVGGTATATSLGIRIVARGGAGGGGGLGGANTVGGTSGMGFPAENVAPGSYVAKLGVGGNTGNGSIAPAGAGGPGFDGGNAGGGGGGGGVTTGNANTNGANGGATPTALGGTGAVAGATGGLGGNSIANSGNGGGGGGGGGGNAAGAGGTGGGGGAYGGGGGGGGGCLNGNLSGAGGSGAVGFLIVITTRS